MIIPFTSIKRFMKISTILISFILTTSGLISAAGVSAQKLSEIKLTIRLSKHNLAENIEELKKQSHLDFAYNKDLFRDLKTAELSFNNAPLNVILDKLLA